VQHAIGIGLGENGGNGKVGGIGLDGGRSVWMEMSENRGCGEGSLQLSEGLAGGGTEIEGLVLPEEPCEWASDLGIPPDEAAIKVSKTKKHLEIVDR
jgi:hypothetical protein